MKGGARPREAEAALDPRRREARLLEIAERLVRTSPAEETEVLLLESHTGLTRFSAGRIHQNVGSEEAWAVVRVAAGKRVGVATASSLRPAAMEEARSAALAIARASDPIEDWPGLPDPRPVEPVNGWDEATARADPEERASAAQVIIERARMKDGLAAGAVETEDETLAIVNSRGVAEAESATRASIHTVVSAGDGSGYAEGLSRRLEDLDADKIGRTAVHKAARSRSPRPIEPGRYDVLLQPPAMAEWLEYLAWTAFSGKAFQEGRSALAGRLGERVTGQRVTISDSARDRRTLMRAFDYEGMPARRLTLIEAGVARQVPTGRLVAHRLGREVSTGHALPATSGGECLPMHLVMRGGYRAPKRLLEEM